jgi:hypothetical protein
VFVSWGRLLENNFDMSHSHSSYVVHQLPEYARDGHPPSYEYPLPAKVNKSTLAALHPWISLAATLTPTKARTYIAARWKELRGDALCHVRDYLLECEVTSLVLTGSYTWLLCVHSNGGFNLVGPPLSSDSVKKQQSHWLLNDNLLLNDFLTHFGGLREDFAPGGGCFINDQEWEGVNKPWMEQVKGQHDWKDSLIVFSSRSGDKLLLHRSGRVGWWIADEMQMRNAYENLETCLLDYVRYREAPWPFEPREPRSNFHCIIG